MTPPRNASVAPVAGDAKSPSGSREQRGRADKKRTERILKAFHEEERFGKAYDARLTKRLWGYLVPYSFLLWASVVVIVVTSIGARAVADMRREAFEFLQQLRLGFFDNQLVGRLVSRVTNDTDAILEMFASGALS